MDACLPSQRVLWVGIRSSRQLCEGSMEIISRVDSAEGPAQLRSIRQVLMNLGRRELIDYFQRALSTASNVDAIAARSSIHANGFSKLVLERSVGLAMRLHVWEPVATGHNRQSENIHDHVWPFASRVLIGGLSEQRFGTARSGEPMDHYRYVRARATLPPGRLELLGNVRLAMLDELSHIPGTVYHADDTTLHRAWSVNEDSFAATLVLTGSPRSTGASVYTNSGAHVIEDVQEARLSSITVQRLIGVAIDALQ